MRKKYPPEERIPVPKYHPDDYKRIAASWASVDYKANLSRAFRERIAKVKGARR